MWVTRRLDDARRRLRPAPPAVVTTGEVAIEDLAVSLVRTELDRLLAALTASDPAMPRADSPVLLARALASAIARVGGTGEPTVTRSPAGLYTPEFWHIRVAGADPRTRDALDRLAAGRRIG